MSPAPSTPAPRPIVEAQGLRFRYPGPDPFTLEHARVEITSGEHTACIGPSGCGKTTLLRLLIGVLRPDEGHVRLDGREISSMRETDRRQTRIASVGMVFQSFALLDYLSALDNILLPYRVSSTLRLDEEARERARRLATDLGIARLLSRRPRRLSQGECQRVAICRALVTQPRLIACDEPTGNLDPERSRSTLDLLMREGERTGATVLMVTHNHDLLGRFAQVIDMSGGGS
ncbi:MAG: ATP-binding cassette domain-containing protein [Phycisphaerales bacterium]